MSKTESTSHAELVVCGCGGTGYTARDAIEAALFRGNLTPLWQDFSQRVAAHQRAAELELELDDDIFDAAAEQFRYDHDLITAEETEQWLGARELNLEIFSDYFARLCWGRNAPEGTAAPADSSYLLAAPEMRDVFATDLILSDELENLTRQLSWRLAALTTDRSTDESALAAESQRFFERNEMSPENLADWLGRIGRDEEWFNQCCAMEVTFRRRTESLFGPGALQKELGSQRLTLTRFEVEVIELESRDAAQEALFCVREDGMSMEEVATECRYPYRRMEFLLEDMSEEVQQRFLSVTDGQILDPLPHGDGFELCRIVSRVEPKVDHPNVKARLEWRLISRHFSELASKHVERRLGAPTSTE